MRVEWRDKHLGRPQHCFSFLLQKFKLYYLPYIFPEISNRTNVYRPDLGMNYRFYCYFFVLIDRFYWMCVDIFFIRQWLLISILYMYIYIYFFFWKQSMGIPGSIISFQLITIKLCFNLLQIFLIFTALALMIQVATPNNFWWIVELLY